MCEILAAAHTPPPLLVQHLCNRRFLFPDPPRMTPLYDASSSALNVIYHKSSSLIAVKRWLYFSLR
jgi:hypothetical protein